MSPGPTKPHVPDTLKPQVRSTDGIGGKVLDQQCPECGHSLCAYGPRHGLVRLHLECTYCHFWKSVTREEWRWLLTSAATADSHFLSSPEDIAQGHRASKEGPTAT